MWPREWALHLGRGECPGSGVAQRRWSPRQVGLGVQAVCRCERSTYMARYWQSHLWLPSASRCGSPPLPFLWGGRGAGYSAHSRAAPHLACSRFTGARLGVTGGCSVVGRVAIDSTSCVPGARLGCRGGSRKHPVAGALRRNLAALADGGPGPCGLESARRGAAPRLQGPFMTQFLPCGGTIDSISERHLEHAEQYDPVQLGDGKGCRTRVPREVGQHGLGAAGRSPPLPQMHCLRGGGRAPG